MGALDLAQLIAPIAGDSPVGVDLRAAEDSIYHDLRFLRRECRDEERQFTAGTIEAPDSTKWEELARGCALALREQTKDLELACWLLEAQVRVNRDGASAFAGLRDGFKLVDALCSRYWDTAFSVQDDSDPDARFAPIVALNGALWSGTESPLIAAIRRIPLTPREPPGPFSYAEIQQRDKFDMADIYDAARLAGFDFFRTMAGDISDAYAAADALDETLSRGAGGYGSIRHIRELLYDVRKTVARMSTLCAPPPSAS